MYFDKFCSWSWRSSTLGPMTHMIRKERNLGFTLIELLIVMAILGVLAVILLVIMNPGERQAQARDTGRISAVVQIGKSLQAYYTTKTEVPGVERWADDLVTSGELSTFPAGIKYSYNSVTSCYQDWVDAGSPPEDDSYAQPEDDPTYCYDEDKVNGNGAIVFSKAESTSYRNKCIAPAKAYFVYSTDDGRGGTICSDVKPEAGPAGSLIYIQ